MFQVEIYKNVSNKKIKKCLGYKLEILMLDPISPTSIYYYLYFGIIFDTCNKMVFTPSTLINNKK